MLLAGTIFILTLVLVIWQPRGLGIGWSAAFGAALALATGGVQVADIPVVWHIVWNATATFIAVIIISLLLDESGFFEWAALHVSRWGRGRGRLLFTWIILLGAAVAALFANDGAALILTPIVIAMLRALGFSKGTMLAFVMAAGFIADTASLPLVVSNLVNIVSADFFAIGFREYASVMVPVDLAAILTTLAMLHLFFRKDIPPAWDMALLKAPATAIKDPATFRTGWGVLLLLLAGFFVLEPLGIPVSAIAALGAGILFAVAKRGRVINTGKVLRGAPWQIVIFSLGMYLVVYGLRNAGLTDYLTTVLNMLAERGLWAATLGTGILSAFLSSIMSSIPRQRRAGIPMNATAPGCALNISSDRAVWQTLPRRAPRESSDGQVSASRGAECGRSGAGSPRPLLPPTFYRSRCTAGWCRTGRRSADRRSTGRPAERWAGIAPASGRTPPDRRL